MFPSFVRHYSEIQEPDDAHYPGSEELHSIGSPFSRELGLTQIGVHHELLPPGRRTSFPHAEETDEEFVFVIEGNPDLWLDGRLYRLSPGFGVAFRAGTGIAHTFINNTKFIARLLVVGSPTIPRSRTYYPLNPEIKDLRPSRWWSCPFPPELGPHNGLPEWCAAIRVRDQRQSG